MTRTVFLSLTRPEARELQAGAASGPTIGFAATEALQRAAGADGEEAGFLAQTHAGVHALLDPAEQRRLVLAAEVADAQVGETGDQLGTVELSDLRWGQVLSLFADEPAAADAVATAREAVSGLDLAAALTRPEVAALLDGWDLLWFAPEELDRIP